MKSSEIILNHLMEKGSITVSEARTLYSIYNLSDVVIELRIKGYLILLDLTITECRCQEAIYVLKKMPSKLTLKTASQKLSEAQR